MIYLTVLLVIQMAESVIQFYGGGNRSVDHPSEDWNSRGIVLIMDKGGMVILKWSEAKKDPYHIVATQLGDWY